MKKILLFIALASIAASAFGQTLPLYLPKVGLIAWYPFTGNANDSSGFSHNGTVVGGASLTTDRFGHANSAYLFNGSTSEITTSLLPPTGNAARTITCWFKYNSLPHPCDYGVALAGYGFNDGDCAYSDKNFSLELCFASSSGAAARIDGICIANAADGAADTLNNTWHFFAAVYDSSFGDFTTIKLYVDGEYKMTHTSIFGSTTAVLTDTLCRFGIGAGHYTACRRFFDGAIDDIGVWNRALNEGELYALYHNAPTAASDSFAVFTRPLCPGPAVFVLPRHYSSTQSVRTSFGDGSSQTDVFQAYSGDTSFNHTYTSSGVYIIKHVLLSGSSAIDSAQYSYSYNMCSAIPVKFYYDANSNCIKDSSDVMLSQSLTIEIDSNGFAIDTLSATSGLYYTAYGSAGDVYAFRVISVPVGIHVTCPTTGVIYDTLGGGTYAAPVKLMGFECTAASGFDLGVFSTGVTTGVHAHVGDIYADNAFCPPMNATVTLRHSPKHTYNDAYPTPTSTTATSITWNISALSSIDAVPTHLYYHLEITGSPLTPGDTVNSNIVIAPETGDADTTNNVIVIIDTARAGFDPNEISVKPEGCIASGAASTQLQYTINFENTGNDTAHNIYVMDTLPPYVDATSMRIVMASHEMYTTKIKDAAGHNIIKFDFPAINLLDSSHHGQCDGAIIFNIKTKPGLATGTDISNRAGIYFDVNPVVMTNKVTNGIGCPPSSVSSLQSAVTSPLVYPNPANDVLNIKVAENSYQSFTISNNIGSVILSGTLTKTNTQLNIQSLPAGLYFITLKGEQGTVAKKVVKW